MTTSNSPPPNIDMTELRRKRRGRNIAMVLVLAGLCALFYAITIVKLAKF